MGKPLTMLSDVVLFCDHPRSCQQPLTSVGMANKLQVHKLNCVGVSFVLLLGPRSRVLTMFLSPQEEGF